MTTREPHRVLVLAAPAGRGHALARLSALTARAWRESGARVLELDAPDTLSRRMRAAAPSLVTAESAWLQRMMRRTGDVDLIHVIDPRDAALAVRLPSRPRVVVTVHDPSVVLSDVHEPTSWRHLGDRSHRGRQGTISRALQAADAVLATSEFAADALSRELQREIQVLPPPLDPSLGERSSRLDTFKAPAWPYLLCVSSSAPHARRLASIEAWTHLRRTPHLDGVSLVVVGDGLSSAEEALVTACGGHVSVFSDISSLQVSALYSRSRAVLALGEPRSFPWTVIEAHQAGRPVLATDHEVFQEAGGSGCVYLPVEGVGRFDHHTWMSIAEDLTSGLVAERAAANAENFEWDHFVADLPDLAGWKHTMRSDHHDLDRVDLSRLDALLEASPWSAPPLTLAQLATPLVPAPWSIPAELEQDFYVEDEALVPADLHLVNVLEPAFSQQISPREQEGFAPFEVASLTAAGLDLSPLTVADLTLADLPFVPAQHRVNAARPASPQ